MGKGKRTKLKKEQEESKLKKDAEYLKFLKESGLGSFFDLCIYVAKTRDLQKMFMAGSFTLLKWKVWGYFKDTKIITLSSDSSDVSYSEESVSAQVFDHMNSMAFLVFSKLDKFNMLKSDTLADNEFKADLKEEDILRNLNEILKEIYKEDEAQEDTEEFKELLRGILSTIGKKQQDITYADINYYLKSCLEVACGSLDDTEE